MSGIKKDDRSRDGSGKSSPVSGAGLGLLSMIKNKKIMTVIGGILIVIGIAGMVAVGSNALSTINGGVCIYVPPDSGPSCGDIFTDHTAVTESENERKRKPQ